MNETLLSVSLEGGEGREEGKTGLILCQKTISRYCPFKPIRKPGNKGSTFIGYRSSPNEGTESTFMYRAKEDI